MRIKENCGASFFTLPHPGRKENKAKKTLPLLLLVEGVRK